MVPLTINSIYNLSGYLLRIFLLKGSNRGVKKQLGYPIPRGPHHFPYENYGNFDPFELSWGDASGSSAIELKIVRTELVRLGPWSKLNICLAFFVDLQS